MDIKNKLNRHLVYIIFFVVVITGQQLDFAAQVDIYGGIPAWKYLSGRINPSKHKKFVSLNDFNILTNNRTHYLRIETVLALQQMLYAFHEKHPNVPFRLISTTRNYYSQRSIWMDKWNGKRLVNGKKLNTSIKNPINRAIKILEFSSMPGTSRHHWGTDFDLNSLSNAYFESGEGKILYDWLQRNAYKYGFAQPYINGRSAGYMEEKWHWSYIPLSRKFLNDWNHLYESDCYFFIKGDPIPEAHKLYKLAPIYVNTINNACK